ncbi:MAG: methionyl aminopeptidase [Clostridia bacterium]|nr:methionyl aminopeptidase [Clostridia bacterium]
MLEKLGRNLPCWCGSGKKYKNCHIHFDEELEALEKQGEEIPTHRMIKNAEQIARIKESCKVNIAVLDAIDKIMKPGVRGDEINDLVNEVTYSMGAIPAPLHYEGYPYSVCTSVNSQVCHGFPLKSRVFKEGDIVNVDCSSILDGYFSDSSRMYCLGEVSPARKKLVEVTRECMKLGIEAVKPYGHLGDIGAAIDAHARANGYRVVDSIGGHGCGIEFHEDPFVSHVGEAGTGMLLIPGMIFTIEPMVNAGGADYITDKKNNWEVYTRDGKDSAQWENMILVTETGYEILCW